MQVIRLFLLDAITPLLLPALISAWKRRKAPFIPACVASRLVTPLISCLGGCVKSAITPVDITLNETPPPR